MGEKTGVSWAHHTFNPWWGCQKVSRGCENCYAETFSVRLGRDLWGPKADRKIASDTYWKLPLKWARDAAAAGERQRVFCASMADVFEDRRDLDEPRARLWALIEDTPDLDWLLLTKRPENMNRLAPARWADRWPSHAWGGITGENQHQLERRWAHLHGVPTLTRFLSIEPMLAPIDIGRAFDRVDDIPEWVIVGGETAPDADRIELDVPAAEQLAHDCEMFDLPLFVKQDSGRYPGRQGRLPDWMWARKQFPAPLNA